MSYYQDEENAGGRPNGLHAYATSAIPGRDDDRKLFVGGLSLQTTDRDLLAYFSKFGDIESITVKVNPLTGQSRCFAFVVFSNAKSIDELMAGGDHYINKKKVDPRRVTKKVKQGKIFVGGLNLEITDNDIKEYFDQYGTVEEVQRPYDKVKNQQKGFCFVTFESQETCREVLKKPKQYIKNKQVDVKKVILNPETMMMGGVGRGGAGGRGRGVTRGLWTAPRPYDEYGGFGEDAYGSGYDSYDCDSYNYPGAHNGYESSVFRGGYGTGTRRGAGRLNQRPQPY